MKRIAVFCGAATGADARYAEMAREVGTIIAQRGVGIVYGGGHVGLMGLVADAAMRANSEVIGVIPRFMEKAEQAHEGVTDLILVSTMHERKQRMHELSDAVMALPGGFGTLDELLEALTLIQTGKSRKIPIILVCSSFWAGLVDWFRTRLIDEKMIDPTDMELIQVIDDPARVVEAIFKHYEARPFAPLPNEREMMLNL